MDMNISVPSRLLEDIFRLLDYLGDVSGYDEMHFHKAGYSPRFEHDTALWELKIKIRQLQGRIMETYLLTIDGITEDEMNDVEKWVAGGRSVYDNPCLIWDGSGRPMDFVNACRLDAEMSRDPSQFFGGESDIASEDGWDDDLPF